ncbi:MAG: DUF2783 domain-containing protein [Pseudomonadota bacterium]|nr:DUF2783 domain-containing protein [Pseudomonadota bacterium]
MAGQAAGQAAGDAFYAKLIDAHRDLSDAQSELLNARLVLLLANHVGDLGVLEEALLLARRGIDVPTADSMSKPGPVQMTDTTISR